MNKLSPRVTVLWISFLLVVLVGITSVTGLYTPEFYAREAPNWQVQSVGQDLVNLFLIVPVLICSAFLTYKKRKAVILVWGGVLLYLVYTFTIYCFAVHFNKLFIIYCFIWGLSFYGFSWFLFNLVKEHFPTEAFVTIPRLTTGIFFIILSVLFYLLWFFDIVTAMFNNQIPENVKETGLYTNPVHVLDISILLPGVLIIAVFLLKKKLLGFLLAPVLLAFFILMDITIGILAILLKNKGMDSGYEVVVIMGFLTVFSCILLLNYIKKIDMKILQAGSEN